MKKNLFGIITFLLLSLNLNAQWELVQDSYSQFGSLSQKDSLIVLTLTKSNITGFNSNLCFYYSKDMGKTWQMKETSTTGFLGQSVYLTQKGLYLFERDSIFFTDNFGASWKKQNFYNIGSSFSFFEENDSLHIIRPNAYIFQTKIGENNWNQGEIYKNLEIKAIDKKRILYSKYDNGVVTGVIYRDSSKASTSYRSGYYFPGKFVLSKNLIVTADNLYNSAKLNYVYISKDDGQTWQQSSPIPSATTGAKEITLFLKNDTIYVAGQTDIYYSTDIGKTWRSLYNEVEKEPNLVYRKFSKVTFEGSVFYLLMNDDYLYSIDVNNKTWKRHNDLIRNFDPTYISALPNGRLMTQNDNMYSDDNGKTWKTLEHFSPTTLFTKPIATDKYAFGYDETYPNKPYISKNNGDSWDKLASILPKTYHYSFVGDTIVMIEDAGTTIVYSPQYPYNNWKKIAKAEYWTTKTHLYNGTIYTVNELARTFLRYKLDGSKLPDIEYKYVNTSYIYHYLKDKAYFGRDTLFVCDFAKGTISTLKIFDYIYNIESDSEGNLIVYSHHPNFAPTTWGSKSGVFKSFDGGTSWIALNDGLSSTGHIARFSIANDYMFCGIGLSVYRRSSALNGKTITGTVY
jgi:BNR/Asp-box repeat